LTRGKCIKDCSNLPPTAPDALRHWTDTQKSVLKSSRKGQKLCELDESQRKKWHNKYESLSVKDKELIDRDLFFWALEAVNSRAFVGNFGIRKNNNTALMTSIFLSLASFLVGGVVLFNQPTDNADFIVVICAILAVAFPIVSYLITNKNGGVADAVMLPIIDSANHIQGADSLIEYDPIKDQFTLKIGPNCLRNEGENNKFQIYITYGDNKSDSELLLNYGFLPSLMEEENQKLSDNIMTTSSTISMTDEKRKRLAEEFMKRNF